MSDHLGIDSLLCRIESMLDVMCSDVCDTYLCSSLADLRTMYPIVVSVGYMDASRSNYALFHAAFGGNDSIDVRCNAGYDQCVVSFSDESGAVFSYSTRRVTSDSDAVRAFIDACSVERSNGVTAVSVVGGGIRLDLDNGDGFIVVAGE